MPPILIQVQGLLGFENQKKIIKRLSPVKSTVVDALFPEEHRRNNPSPIVRRGDLHAAIKAIALTRRGDGPQRVDDVTYSAEAFEPFPINPYRSITGADLNNWRMWNGEKREQFVIRNIDLNRRTIRLTTEAMAAQAFTTGALDYPVMVDGTVTAKYKITFGSIAAVSVAKLWSAADATLKDVIKVLTDIRKQIQLSGYGGTVKFQAGETAFFELVDLVTSLPNDKRVSAEVKENSIIIAGNEIRLNAETYADPETGSQVKKVPDNAIFGYATDAPHDLIYSALDDIDAGGIAVPFWSKANRPSSGNEIRIISESKPLPVPYTRAIVKAVVTG